MCSVERTIQVHVAEQQLIVHLVNIDNFYSITEELPEQLKSMLKIAECDGESNALKKE